MPYKNKNINPIFKSPNVPRELREGTREAEILFSDSRFLEACELLEGLNRKYPHHPEILELLAYAYAELKNYFALLHVFLDLDRLLPNTKKIKLGLADAYFKNGYRALALQVYRTILRKWQRDEGSQYIENFVHQLELDLGYSAKILDFSLEESIAFFGKHEELQVLMNQGKFARCKEIGKELLALREDFTPVLNNLSHIAWLEGDLTGAIAKLRMVLGFDPENVHALSTICCYLFMIGDIKQVEKYVKQLIAAQVIVPDQWEKKIRALCFIGKYDEALRIIELAKASKELKYCDGSVWHWCAIVEYQHGHVSKARSYWEKCLKLVPHFTLALDNLTEILNVEKYERMCPQEFSMDAWLPKSTFDKLMKVVESQEKEKSTTEVNPDLVLFLNEHPELQNLIKAGVLSGDRNTRNFVMEFIGFAINPELINWLKSYALSDKGPDSLRMKAAQILVRKGIFKSGKKIKFWSRGSQRQVLMFGFEVNYTAMETEKISTAARDLMEKAFFALRNGQGRDAEIYLRKALGIAPHEPRLLNNLALALQMQGKTSEGLIIADKIISEFPDYFFSQIMVSKKAIASGNFRHAGFILEKLMNTTQLHISEFNALCSCQVELGIAEGKLENVELWMDMWEKIDPENPSLRNFQKFLSIDQ